MHIQDQHTKKILFQELIQIKCEYQCKKFQSVKYILFPYFLHHNIIHKQFIAKTQKGLIIFIESTCTKHDLNTALFHDSFAECCTLRKIALSCLLEVPLICTKFKDTITFSNNKFTNFFFHSFVHSQIHKA